MQIVKPLHTLSDGSVLHVISSRELIALPVWKGNRVIDLAHVEEIKRAVGSNVQQLDCGYRLVTYTTTDAAGNPVKETYIVDGQHRARVLLDFYGTSFCEPAFDVVVLEKEVQTEFDVIQYFNALNNSKPIKYTDMNLIVNRYIEELEKAFNTSRKAVMIRPKDTRRPYVSADKLRESLKAAGGRLKDGAADIKAFVGRVRAWNEAKVASAPIDMLSLSKKESDILEAGAKIRFMLGVSVKMPWLDECL